MLYVLFLGFLPGLLFFVLGIHMQPINGDLTRVGAYPERLYGWSTPQRVFAKPLFGSSVAEQSDVLVIGDSFANAMINHQWQNHVVAATGLTVSTVSSYDMTVGQVLRDPAFQARPPRFLVLTLVERHFPRELAHQVSCSAPLTDTLPAVPETAVDTSASEVYIPSVANGVQLTRPTEWADWRDVTLGLAVKQLVRESVYQFSGRQITRAWQYGLERRDLFSNAVPDRLLVYRDDIEKTVLWREVGPAGIDCLIDALRQQVEANGRTRLVLLVPPDKLTAYAPWVTDPTVRQLSELNALTRRHSDLMPPINRALHQAIAAGHADIYLPNNTHWGIKGHMVVGHVVTEFLQRSADR